MTFVWSLTLYQMAKGYRVVIKGDGRTVEGQGRTAQEAHRAAECKLVVKPWVCAEPADRETVTPMAEILHFPDRSLLKLIEAVNGVLDGTVEPTAALTLAETVLSDMGAVKDSAGHWQLRDAVTGNEG